MLTLRVKARQSHSLQVLGIDGGKMDIEKIIREFLMEEFKENGFHDGIRDDESLIDADIMDSLGILTAISFLEEKFGIISGEDETSPYNFDSIIAISKFVKKKLGRKKVRDFLKQR